MIKLTHWDQYCMTAVFLEYIFLKLFIKLKAIYDLFLKTISNSTKWNFSYCSWRIICIKLDGSFSFWLVNFSESIWFTSLKIMHSCLTSFVPKSSHKNKSFSLRQMHVQVTICKTDCNSSPIRSCQYEQNKLVLYYKTNWRPNCYLLPKQKSTCCLHILKDLSGSIFLQISQYQMFN